MGLYTVWGEKRYCTNCKYKTLSFPLTSILTKIPVTPFEMDRCSGCAKKYETTSLQITTKQTKKDKDQMWVHNW